MMKPIGSGLIKEDTIMKWLGALLNIPARIYDLFNRRDYYVPISLFFITALVYGAQGLNGEIARDSAVYMYAGQRMADGVPFYVSVFDHKGPLGPMVIGTVVMIANALGWEDIHTVRLFFYFVNCFTIVSLYFLGATLFKSKRVGLFSALTLLTFHAHSFGISIGPEPKALMVLTEILSLYFMSKKEWFRTGLFTSLSVLIWQPMGILFLISLLLAIMNRKKGTFNDLWRCCAGFAIPIVLVFLYYLKHDAVPDLINGMILFNFNYMEPPETSLIGKFVRPVRDIYRVFTIMFVPIMIGFLMFFFTYIDRLNVNKSIKKTFLSDRFSPLFLAFPVFLIWAFFYFETGGGHIGPFFPFITIGFGKFIDNAVKQFEISYEFPAPKDIAKLFTIGLCAVFLSTAAVNMSIIRNNHESQLDIQRQDAQLILDTYGEEISIMSIGAPQVIVLLQRINPNPYIFIIKGMDKEIDAKTEGGFQGWLDEIESYDPDIIAYGKTEGEFIPLLMSWLDSRYHIEHFGQWTAYVNNNLTG